MTDAELAALARAATTVPPTVTTYPDWMLPLGKHMRAWTPERALAALAVIACARRRSVHGLDDALAAWDALSAPEGAK